MEKQDRKWMINHAYNELVKEIRRELLDEILEDIRQRIFQMEKLLENGEPFWLYANGESFKRIHEARQKIYIKMSNLNEIWYSITERY